jgi:hypothetical protein
MPNVWSWYQWVEARSAFGYWKVAEPAPQVIPCLLADLAAKKSYHEPTVAYPAGMLRAAGRYQASAYPSLSSPTPTAPCTWVTSGTGPLYRPGVASNAGRVSRPPVPPDGFAQCSVGSTGSRCGRKSPLTSTSSLTHFTRTGRPCRASIVREGAWCTRSARGLSAASGPYPHTVVFPNPAGRICWSNWRTEIS